MFTIHGLTYFSCLPIESITVVYLELQGAFTLENFGSVLPLYRHVIGENKNQ